MQENDNGQQRTEQPTPKRIDKTPNIPTGSGFLLKNIQENVKVIKLTVPTAALVYPIFFDILNA